MVGPVLSQIRLWGVAGEPVNPPPLGRLVDEPGRSGAESAHELQLKLKMSLLFHGLVGAKGRREQVKLLSPVRRIR